MDLGVEICPRGAAQGNDKIVKEKLYLNGVKLYAEQGELALTPSTKTEVFADTDSAFTITNTTGITFTPEVDIAAKIKYARLESAHIKVKGDIELSQILEAVNQYQSAESLETTKKLFSKSFIKLIPTTIPILVRGELDIFLKVKGDAYGKMAFKEEMSSTYTLEYGLKYDRSTGGWKPVNNFENSFNLEISGQAEAGLEATVTLIPEIRLYFYEAVSGGFNLQPYLYANAGVEGSFDYQVDYDTQNFDMSYSFTSLEAGGGVDVQLYGGLEIFDTTILAYPDRNASIDDRGTWETFSPVPKTQFTGIPELSVTPTSSNVLAANSRALAVVGSYTNVRNPLSSWGLGKEYYIFFDQWFDPELISTESTCSGSFLDSTIDGNDTNFWFLPGSTGNCAVRLAGYSNLGWFVRQTKQVNFDLTDSDNDNMIDYWEARFGLNTTVDDATADADGDSYTNIFEYYMGTRPDQTTDSADLIDHDNDGMQDNWEVFFGLDPNNPADASGDLDNDGMSNLDEFLAGSGAANSGYAKGWRQMQSLPAILDSCLDYGDVKIFAVGNYGYLLTLGCTSNFEEEPNFQLWRFDPNDQEIPWSHISDWPRYRIEPEPGVTLTSYPGIYDPFIILNGEVYFTAPAENWVFDGVDYTLQATYKLKFPVNFNGSNSQFLKPPCGARS